MPRFSLKVALAAVVALSVLAIPIVRAARAEADASLLGERALARLRSVPAETWLEAMEQERDMHDAFRRIATDEGRNLLDTGEITQMSVVDITENNDGTRAVAAGPSRKIAILNRATGEARGDGGALVRLLSADGELARPEGGVRRLRYFVLVDLSAVERARWWRRAAIVAAIALAVLAGAWALVRSTRPSMIDHRSSMICAR
jgi:hypothetical protein